MFTWPFVKTRSMLLPKESCAANGILSPGRARMMAVAVLYPGLLTFRAPEIFTPFGPLVTTLAGSCASGIIPVMFAALTEFALAALLAWIAYGADVRACRGASVVKVL